MFQIIMVPKGTGATACLYYDKKEDADAARQRINDAMNDGSGTFSLSDDYGFVLTMDITNLSYSLLIDVNRSNALHSRDIPKKRIYDS